MDKETRESIDGLRQEVNALKISVDALTIENKALTTQYEEHDKILVRGRNGTPSIQEDVRSLLKLAGSLRFWMTAIAIAFIGQFAAVGITMILYILRAMP